MFSTRGMPTRSFLRFSISGDALFGCLVPDSSPPECGSATLFAFTGRKTSWAAIVDKVGMLCL